MLSRRNAMLTALAASTSSMERSRAQTAPAAPQGIAASPTTVLQVKRRTIVVNGKPASILGVSQPDGTADIVTSVGKQFRVRLENQLDVPTLIHWHGMTPPWQQDGVPGISGPPVAAGSSAEYDFPLRFGGTLWMHAHQGLQEQELLAAPLIIHDDRDRPGQQEIVVMLADFSFTPPDQIFDLLRKSGSMAGMAPAAAGSGRHAALLWARRLLSCAVAPGLGSRTKLASRKGLRLIARHIPISH
jgi:FtsP/CotA-like multicopper oxidase with cupredoxin domain